MKKIKAKSHDKSCPCGSGKKYKKCCLNRTKDRVTRVTLDMGVPTEANGLKFDPQSGEVALLHDGVPLAPVSAHIETGYERLKGTKVLNRAALLSEELNANPNRRLEDFDLIFAIDTNSRRVGDKTISVSCIVLGRNVLILGHTAIEYGPITCLEFRNIIDKAENIAWQKCIELIQAAPDYKDSLKIGLIVDSDMGNLSGYNSGELALYEHCYLPSNFQMIYASSDSGQENIVNQMIRRCDKEAKRLLQRIINEDNDTDLEVVDNQPYTHFKFWVAESHKASIQTSDTKGAVT